MSNEQVQAWQDGVGDMSPEQFQQFGHQVVDWMAGYMASVGDYPVLSTVQPGEIAASLPRDAPDSPQPMEDILADFERLIMPGITHWNHPGFFSFFGITGSGPGVLGEMLAAGLNVNGMLWRTSPAASELETVALGWLRNLVHLPPAFEGVIYDTASISTLVAIAAAREATGLEIRQRGMAGRRDLPMLTMYCSEQSHSSVEKAALTLGIGQEAVRHIETDADFRMDAGALERAVASDRASGHRPFCVVATVGTTATTSVDPVPSIAEIAGENEMWLHVDAAYAGPAAILPERAWIMDGVERADSVVLNPHKWLFTPVDLSAFYSRRLDVVREAFTLIPAYLRTSEGDSVRDYMNYGPQLGRRFRALKLWFVLRAFGREGIERRLREHIRLAQLFRGWVEDTPEWEVAAPTPFSTVCFRATPAGVPPEVCDRLNASVAERINATGEAFISPTVLDGRTTLRLAIGNLKTEERHVRRAWDLLVEALSSLEVAAR